MPKTIALFHSVLGVRQGILDAEARLRAAGHDVRIVDQYDGRTFDTYEEAGAFAEDIGFPRLMAMALEAVADLPDGFVPMGFSNGAGMATYVSCARTVDRAVLVAGALPLHVIDIDAWPAAVPAQLHFTCDDPFMMEGSVESVMRSVNEAGAVAEYIQYPGAGHLFTDASLPAEFDAAGTESFWRHVLGFLAD